MAKLIYRTKDPRKSCVFNESFMTHENRIYENLPDVEIQEKAMRIVADEMHVLLRKLEELGYDPTKVRFSIYTKL